MECIEKRIQSKFHGVSRCYHQIVLYQAKIVKCVKKKKQICEGWPCSALTTATITINILDSKILFFIVLFLSLFYYYIIFIFNVKEVN